MPEHLKSCGNKASRNPFVVALLLDSRLRYSGLASFEPEEWCMASFEERLRRPVGSSEAAAEPNPFSAHEFDTTFGLYFCTVGHSSQPHHPATSSSFSSNVRHSRRPNHPPVTDSSSAPTSSSFRALSRFVSTTGGSFISIILFLAAGCFVTLDPGKEGFRCGPEDACVEGLVCVEGLCVADPCSYTDCGPGELCLAGSCHPIDCPNRSCPAEMICLDGQCVSVSCVDVVCEDDHGCANGRCYPTHCEGVDCGNGVCVDGECVPRSCVEVTCPEGEACANGNCYPTDCLEQCPDGYLCVDGQCIEAACVGVECPAGQPCRGGVCVEPVVCDPGYGEHETAPGECHAELWVECDDSGTPENAAAEAEDVRITWSDGEGWSHPAPCEWSCDAGYGEHEMAPGECHEELWVECDDLGTPENAAAEAADVRITWSDDEGWSHPAPCEWSCNAGYGEHETVPGECHAALWVECDDSGTPENATPEAEDVQITWSDGAGWSEPSSCSWSCDDGYRQEGNECLVESLYPNIYVTRGTSPPEIRKINTNGDVVWSHYIDSDAEAVAVDPQGNVYLATFRDGFIKLDSQGDLEWQLTSSTFGTYSYGTSVAAGPDGTVFLGGTYYDPETGSEHGPKFLEKVDSSGVVQWGYPGSPGPLAVDSYGYAYTHYGRRNTGSDRLHKVSPEGELVWEYNAYDGENTSSRVIEKVVVDTVGNVYVAIGYRNHVQILNSDGELIHTAPFDFPGSTTGLTICPDGYLYGSAEHSSLFKLRPFSDEVVWESWECSSEVDHYRVNHSVVDSSGFVYGLTSGDIRKLDGDGVVVDRPSGGGRRIAIDPGPYGTFPDEW